MSVFAKQKQTHRNRKKNYCLTKEKGVIKSMRLRDAN